ncbi:MAG: MbnP family copper-binding protein [Myxococcota bacterium]
MGARSLALAVLATGWVAGCGDDDEPVTIAFEAAVGDESFQCGQTYEGLGATGSDFTARDLRLYVHDVALLDAEGEPVAVNVDDDGQYQHAGVTLLDLADGGPGCNDGEETHTEVTGSAPPGEYTGLRFTVGVPFELNHDDVGTAPPPLNINQMFWNWLHGRIFVRVDGSTEDLPGFRAHIGSTACQGDNVQTPATSCDNENRPEVELTGFDPRTEPVVVDLAGLLEGMDLTSNTPDTAEGCRAEPNDPDCEPLFHNLGLPWDGVPSPGQQFFRAD